MAGDAALVIFAPVIVVALILTVLAAIEFAVLLLLVPFIAAARMVFGQHWVVEVRLAASISRGDLPLHTLGDDAGPVSPS